MRPLLFLYNPTAGKGHISQRLHGIVERLTQGGWLVSAYPTQGKGDAARMVRDAPTPHKACAPFVIA